MSDWFQNIQQRMGKIATKLARLSIHSSERSHVLIRRRDGNMGCFGRVNNATACETQNGNVCLDHHGDVLGHSTGSSSPSVRLAHYCQHVLSRCVKITSKRGALIALHVTYVTIISFGTQYRMLSRGGGEFPTPERSLALPASVAQRRWECVQVDGREPTRL